MNRCIIGRLGMCSLLAGLFAIGCAVEQIATGGDDQTGQGDEGSQMVGFSTNGEELVSAGERPTIEHHTTPTGQPDKSCVGCGPLPDPWKMGPLPDPWSSSSSSSSSGGSNSSSGGGSNSSSSGGGSNNGKP